MKIFWKSSSKYLPLITFLFVLFSVTSAFAGFGDWVADKAGAAAAAALGIDTSDNCVPPMEHTSCMFCGMFKIIYQAGSAVAERAYTAFHSDLGKLIAVFLAVSLALIVLKNVAAMNSLDPGTLVNDLLKKTFVAITILIITTQDYYNIINLTIVPIIHTALGFIETSGGSSTSCAVSAGGLPGFVSFTGTRADAGLPSEIGQMIICAVDNIESKIDVLFEYARYGFCRGLGPSRLFHILPHPVYIIDAIILYLGGLFFLISYPWVLADAVLQLGISLALLPFAVAGYAFEGTKGYLGKVFSWILNSMFVFLFTGILITCALDYIASLILGLSDSSVGPDAIYINSNSGIAFYGPNMVMIIFMLVIGITYLEHISELASVFSEGTGLSAAQTVGSQVKSVAEKQIGKVGEKAFEAVGDATVWTAKRTVEGFRAGTRHAAMYMTNQWGHQDANGNMTFNVGTKFTPKWLNRGLSFTAEKQPDGSTILKREFTSATGRKHTMVSDKYSTIKYEYARDGREIRASVRFKKDFLENHLFKSDGTMNVGAVNKLLSSDLAKDPKYREALLAELNKQALKRKGLDIGKYYHSRTVKIDPSNPYKTEIVQVDHSKKETTQQMVINPATGQIAVSTKQGPVTDVVGFYNEYVATSSGLNGKALTDLLNSKAGQDLSNRSKIVEKLATDALLSQGIDLNNNSSSRSISFDPSNPNIAIITQLDASGQPVMYRIDTTVDPSTNSFKIEKLDTSGATFDPTTGTVLDASGVVFDPRTATTTQTYNISTASTTPNYKFTKDYEIFFDNGVVQTRTTGKCDAYGIMADRASETTKFTYAEAIQGMHDSIASSNDAKQVVDSNGGISSYCQSTLAWDPTSPNKYDLTFGLNDAFGAPTIGGMPTADFVVQNVLAEGRRQKTNKVQTTISDLYF